jgi:hypothetical protein
MTPERAPQLAANLVNRTFILTIGSAPYQMTQPENRILAAKQFTALRHATPVPRGEWAFQACFTGTCAGRNFLSRSMLYGRLESLGATADSVATKHARQSFA